MPARPVPIRAWHQASEELVLERQAFALLALEEAELGAHFLGVEALVEHRRLVASVLLDLLLLESVAPVV